MPITWRCDSQIKTWTKLETDSLMTHSLLRKPERCMREVLFLISECSNYDWPVHVVCLKSQHVFFTFAIQLLNGFCSVCWYFHLYPYVFLLISKINENDLCCLKLRASVRSHNSIRLVWKMNLLLHNVGAGLLQRIHPMNPSRCDVFFTSWVQLWTTIMTKHLP